jgi:hypothetical protein
MVNAFNLMSKRVIFQKNCTTCGYVMKFILFVHAFYVFESLLFYNHHNCEGNVIVIPFAMEICKSDPLGKALFTLAHFRALCFTTSHFPSCPFPSIINNIHVIGPYYIELFTYEHF